jgi:type IV secretion system protein TrbL
MWGIIRAQSLTSLGIDPMAPIAQQFADVQASWFLVLFDYAQHLFLSLALIEMGLGAMLWMTQGRDVDQIGGSLFRKIMWIGFMYAVLIYANTWIPAVINSFIEAGATASGVGALNPGEVVTQGLAIAAKMLWTMKHWGLLFQPVTMIVGIVSALGVVFAFFLIALQLLLTLIESYIVTGAGIFLLGFAAFRGTATISERYLSYVMAVGIKLFMIYLIVGAGATLAPQWGALISEDSMQTFAVPLAVLCAAAAYGVVAWHIPSLASSAISGTVGFGAGEVIASAFMATRMMPSMKIDYGGGKDRGLGDGSRGGASGPWRAGPAIMSAPVLGSAPRGLGPEGKNPALMQSVPRLGLPAPEGSSDT